MRAWVRACVCILLWLYLSTSSCSSDDVCLFVLSILCFSFSLFAFGGFYNFISSLTY